MICVKNIHQPRALALKFQFGQAHEWWWRWARMIWPVRVCARGWPARGPPNQTSARARPIDRAYPPNGAVKLCVTRQRAIVVMSGADLSAPLVTMVRPDAAARPCVCVYLYRRRGRLMGPRQR